MILRKISETAKTITLGWNAVAGAVGYRGARKSYLNADGSLRWSQAGQDATSMKFSKDQWYRIEALSVLDSGVYPPVTPDPTGPTGPPPPTVAYPSTTRYPSEVLH